ncbi:hypothetical protein PR048_030873, partial [Dryococelus australis]
MHKDGSSEETKREITQYIRPNEKNIKINKIIKTNSHAIIIEIPNEEQAGKLEDEIRNKEVKMKFDRLQKTNPKIMVYGVKANRTKNIIIETSPRIYKRITNKKNIYCGWEAYNVKEFVSPMRCRKCNSYGHTEKRCRQKEEICGKCGEEGHATRTCKEEHNKCINCIRGQQKREDTNHTVTLTQNLDYGIHKYETQEEK